MFLSVIICTYNRVGLLEKTIDSILNQNIDKNIYEIIIVDNNSSDSTSDIVKKYTAENNNLRYVYEQKQGKSFAANKGIKEAAGEYLGFLDDDVIVCNDWCERIIKIFSANSKVVAIGGKIIPYYMSSKPFWFDDRFEIRSWGKKEQLLTGREVRNGFSGANMAFRKQILLEIKGFNEAIGPRGNIFMMGEDTELFSRIAEIAPYFYYCPEMVVSHFVPANSMKLKYRLSRAFKSGIGSAKIKKSRLKTSSLYLWVIGGFIVTIYDFLIETIRTRFSIKYTFFKFVFNLFSRFGSFYEVCFK